MLYLLIWCIVLTASIYLFKQAGGSLSLLKPNMNSIIFYYSFFISSFIGTLLIAMEVDDYYMINRLSHEEYRQIGFYIICLVMVLFPLVMMLISKLSNFNAEKEFNAYLAKDISLPFKEKNEFFLIFLMLSVISLASILYTLWKAPVIPILEVALGNSEYSPGELRIMAQREFGGNVLIRNIFAIALTPLLSLIAYVYAVRTGQVKWKLLYLSLFAGAILINIYDLAKSPVFFYLIMFLLLSLYIGVIRFTVRRLVLWGLLGAAALVSMYIVIQGVTDMGSYLSYNSGPVGRLIFAQIAPTFLHFDLYGHLLPFLNGKSLPIITDLFDMDQVRSARVVMETVFPEKVEAGTAGVLNTLYIAEAYANFGYLGVIVSTIYIAALVQILYIVFVRLPKNPVFLCLFIYFTINIPRTLVGGFADFLFNPIWVLMTGLFVGILLFIRLRIDLTAFWQKKKSGNEV
ncbi:oligosaccharide repeat unit polymerase [Cytobacillus pseudoceanisediminis]|uniref:oligosaccharide repeat unit polymerase n=1 Tax=Cytobacillus pseudoceanisediminis TaxID=3051614 RepID=UPI003C2DCA36